MSFSLDSLERLLKYRIADSFRPLATPVDFPANDKSWLDGLLVTDVQFNRIDNERDVALNVIGANGSLVPNAHGFGFHASAVTMDLATDVFFVRAADVASAGLSQPPVRIEKVPGFIVHIIVRAGVDVNGVPQLQMELDAERLKGRGLPAPIIDAIVAASTQTFPFDLRGAVEGLFPPVAPEC
jgi:hypothetical protein